LLLRQMAEASRIKASDTPWWNQAAAGFAESKEAASEVSSSRELGLLAAVDHAAEAARAVASSSSSSASAGEEEAGEKEAKAASVDEAAAPNESAAQAAILNQAFVEGVIEPLEEDGMWNAKVDKTLCRHWNLRFWPQVNFLSQEVRRRVQALPEEPTPEQQGAVNEFTKKLGYLSCQDLLDPRQGHSLPEYAEHILPVWEQLAKAPNTSFEVPKLGPWFADREEMIWGGHGCAWWFQMLSCDLGYISEKLSGSKASNPSCWNTLQWPYWNQDHPTGPDYFKMVYERLDPDPLGYLKCQEHPLTFDTLEEICATYHVYAPGPPNLWWMSKEDAQGNRYVLDVAKPPEQYADVLKCNKKTGFDKKQNWPDFPGYTGHIIPSKAGMF